MYYFIDIVYAIVVYIILYIDRTFSRGNTTSIFNKCKEINLIYIVNNIHIRLHST